MAGRTPSSTAFYAGFRRTRASALPWSEFSGLIITFTISSLVSASALALALAFLFHQNDSLHKLSFPCPENDQIQSIGQPIRVELESVKTGRLHI